MALEVAKVIRVAGVDHPAAPERSRRHHDGIDQRRPAHDAERFARRAPELRRHVFDDHGVENPFTRITPAAPPLHTYGSGHEGQKAATHDGAERVPRRSLAALE